ncbi:hypothetical protein BDV11DRAFT_186604 [Aspergillus similis]
MWQAWVAAAHRTARECRVLALLPCRQRILAPKSAARSHAHAIVGFGQAPPRAGCRRRTRGFLPSQPPTPTQGSAGRGGKQSWYC